MGMSQQYDKLTEKANTTLTSTNRSTDSQSMEEIALFCSVLLKLGIGRDSAKGM